MRQSETGILGRGVVRSLAGRTRPEEKIWQVLVWVLPSRRKKEGHSMVCARQFSKKKNCQEIRKQCAIPTWSPLTLVPGPRPTTTPVVIAKTALGAHDGVVVGLHSHSSAPYCRAYQRGNCPCHSAQQSYESSYGVALCLRIRFGQASVTSNCLVKCCPSPSVALSQCLPTVARILSTIFGANPQTRSHLIHGCQPERGWC